MSYRVTTEQRANQQGLDGNIHVLSDATGSRRAEVWPALGFNCFRWLTTVGNTPVEVLYADPALFEDGRPTRSGIPVLFPFPNRIRDGRFTWEGKEYQLPLNDGTKKNAIHGFACRKPWRVIGSGADESGAWVAGEFQGSVDAPESLALWPADYGIRVLVRLTASRLQICAAVWSPSGKSLPFGLGYHPYFRVPLIAGETEAEYGIDSPAQSLWQLEESLPTGQRGPADPARDLKSGAALAGLSLDDAYGDIPQGHGPLNYLGSVWSARARVELWASGDFRDLVVFNPPHRQAVCLEPYTCITDAINLQSRGVDAGWQSLAPGASWMGVVEIVCRGG